ncbi:hypothetical protein Tsubulata_049062 [Turnera subulata]|uniref:BZIP domain-containing protein n=1 Tax=Turnera subulata TaxID=218843 RepID=A0A9Q0GHS4_9ROSI|nr:hypothetical protein Tsubulata_049062 [Turnera subulata]
MSVPRVVVPPSSDSHYNNNIVVGKDHKAESSSNSFLPLLDLHAEATSSSSGSGSRLRSDDKIIISKVEESDEDLFTVPDVEAPPAADDSAIVGHNTSHHNNNRNSNSELQHGKRLRGRNPIDKEYRRLKRLLRNRVSAQQARERKKVYVNDLESRAKELLDFNSKLEEKISTLINENTMLRKVLLNTRPKLDESNEPK